MSPANLLREGQVAGSYGQVALMGSGDPGKYPQWNQDTEVAAFGRHGVVVGTTPDRPVRISVQCVDALPVTCATDGVIEVEEGTLGVGDRVSDNGHALSLQAPRVLISETRTWSGGAAQHGC